MSWAPRWPRSRSLGRDTDRLRRRMGRSILFFPACPKVNFGPIVATRNSDSIGELKMVTSQSLMDETQKEQETANSLAAIQ